MRVEINLWLHFSLRVVKTKTINKETIEVLTISNQEQLNTRLIFHERMGNEAAAIVVTVAKDENMIFFWFMF